MSIAGRIICHLSPDYVIFEYKECPCASSQRFYLGRRSDSLQDRFVIKLPPAEEEVFSAQDKKHVGTIFMTPACYLLSCFVSQQDLFQCFFFFPDLVPDVFFPFRFPFPSPAAIVLSFRIPLSLS